MTPHCLQLRDFTKCFKVILGNRFMQQRALSMNVLYFLLLNIFIIFIQKFIKHSSQVDIDELFFFNI